MPAPAPAPAAGFTGFDFSPRVHAEPSTTFGDLFAGTILAATDRRPVRGPDLHLDLAVALEDVARGARTPITVHRLAVCHGCAGAGTVRTSAEDCVACDGSGVTRVKRGHMIFTQPCERCDGTGARVRVACGTCDGAGTEPRSDMVDVDVAPGTVDGAVLRLDGLGHAGRHGGRPGDAYVTVHVAPHPLYRRSGDDLHVEVPVAVHEAALGARVSLLLPDGSAPASGAAGHAVGATLPPARTRPAVGSGTARRGDLVVEVRLMLPRVLDERSKELLREFGRMQRDERARLRAFRREEGA